MPNKAIFLDRDDTLIEDPGYINNPDQVKLLEGAPEALAELKAMGYKLVVVSNQSAVARGIVTEGVLAQIHKRLEQLLAERNVSLDRIYYCPYHPDGVIPKYRRESDLRKPSPGMLLDAGKDMDIDLTESWMVGNSPDDTVAGARAGCRTIMVDRRGPHEQKIQPGDTGPDYRAVNLKEVVNIIKMYLRSSGRPSQNTLSAPPAQAVVQLAAPSAQPEDMKADDVTPQVKPSTEKTEELLAAILEQLKSARRIGMFSESEFLISRFMAGVIQFAVLFCLLIGVWFLMGPDKKTDQILISLGFAAVLQIMALTLYTMQGPR
jgi:D-glycero-D-manno-heptose 1,7-bisphosphate phosphatase